MPRLIRSSLAGLALTSLALLTPAAAASASAAQPEVPAATAVPSTGTCHAGAEIHNSPSFTSHLNGICEPSHAVTVYCLMGMPDGSVWANSLDDTTGVAGWINTTQIDVRLGGRSPLPCI